MARLLLTLLLIAGCSSESSPTAPQWSLKPLDCEPLPSGVPVAIEGTVTNSSGNTIAGASVEIGGQSAVTSDEGSFLITLPSGTTTLEASAPDLNRASGRVTLPHNRRTRIEIRLAAPGEGFIFGRVFDACTGAPIPNVTVNAQPGATRDDGTYVIYACCSTIGSLVFSREGYIPEKVDGLGRIYSHSVALDVVLTPARKN